MHGKFFLEIFFKTESLIIFMFSSFTGTYFYGPNVKKQRSIHLQVCYSI